MRSSLLVKELHPIVFGIVFLCVLPNLYAAPSPKLSDTQQVKQLLPMLSSLRGLSLKKDVPVGREPPQEIEAYIKKRIAEEYPAGEIELERKSLVLLGLIPQTFEYEKFVIGLLREQVAGYYDPEVQKMFLADKLDPASRDAVLLHELTHALQDQHFNLKPMMKRVEGNDDRTNAINALIEGDAFAVMMDFASGGAAAAAHPNFRENMRQALRAEQKSKPELKDAPSFLLESLVFPYVEGMTFVDRVREKSKWDGVNNAFTSPPRSSEQILHPEKFLSKNDPPKEIDAKWMTTQLKDPMRVQTSNVLGEFGLRLALSTRVPASEATTAAEGWGGDRYWLVETSPGGSASLVLASEWDTEKDAQEFEMAWKKTEELPVGDVFRKKKRVFVALELPKIAKDLKSAWFSAP